jgi:hypothetical protein
LKSTYARLSAFALILALVLPGAGCAGDGGPLKMKGPPGHLKWRFDSAGDDHFLGVTSKLDGAYGYLLVKRDLHPPFRWETTVAPRDGAGVGDVDWIATELDAFGSTPLQFWLMGAEPVAGGTNVFAACHLNTSRQGQELFAGATSVDLAIEHDGTDVIFFARKTGGVSWTEIWRRDATGQQFPVQPAVGVVGLGRKKTVGFDDFRVVASSPPQGPITPAYQVILHAYDAVDDLVLAMHDSDGANPDPAGALLHVNDALLHLDDAIAGAGALTATKVKTGPSAALKLLGKARKTAASVVKKLERGKAGKSAIKKLMKAVASALQAAEALTPP